ncbi:Homeobox protein goosecoid [Labeo rohita]|uniref:Homeobox protein goosecoid n=1 Tax=Labeo rohita TaxID=84645 RepID=A0ABQ8LV62_LABRO|nr:Homeobox protein goosecoid [Labeo rohita]
MVKGWQEGRRSTQEEIRVETRHMGGDDGGRSHEENRRGTQATAMMVTHGGADGGRSHGGGSDGSRSGGGGAQGGDGVTLKIRRAKVEQMATAPEADAGIRNATVKPERQRTKIKPEGRRSLTELEGRRNQV